MKLNFLQVEIILQGESLDTIPHFNCKCLWYHCLLSIHKLGRECVQFSFSFKTYLLLFTDGIFSKLIFIIPSFRLHNTVSA